MTVEDYDDTKRLNLCIQFFSPFSLF